MNNIDNQHENSNSPEDESRASKANHPANESDKNDDDQLDEFIDEAGGKDLESSKKPAIPESAYRRLTKVLQDAVSFFDKWYQRDVYLTGLLGVLSACMPNVRLRYGRKVYSPHLFMVILALAASGKGLLLHCLRWAGGIDELLLDESEQARARWQEQKREYDEDKKPSKKEKAKNLFGTVTLAEPPGPEPSENCLIVAEDTTSAALALRLRDNTYGALMVSTELDALSVANAKEYGQFSPTLRRTFHHERVSVDRKGSPPIRIQEPRLALVLSGTLEQFGGLVQKLEDGLYSRFAVYKYWAPVRFESQRPTDNDHAFEAFTEKAKAAMLKLFKLLRGRDKPLWITVPDDLWEEVDRHYKELFGRLFALDKKTGKIKTSLHLTSVVKRGALITFRIAMILCVIRYFEAGKHDKLNKATSIEVSEDDIQAAISLGLVYTEHGLRLAKNVKLPDMSEIGGISRMTGRHRRFFDTLPATFETSEAKMIMEDLGFSRSSCFRWLNRFIEDGLLEREKQGLYRKTTGDET